MVSDVSCRAGPPASPLARERQGTGTEDRLHRPLVNENGFRGPRRLPSTSAPWAALSRMTHFRDWLGARHRYRRFATERSGFRRSFTSQAFARQEARPFVVFQVLFTPGREGPRAARRFLQPMRSANTTTAARTPQNHTRGRPLMQLFVSVGAAFRWRAELRMAGSAFTERPAESSRARGRTSQRFGCDVGSSHRDRSR